MARLHLGPGGALSYADAGRRGSEGAALIAVVLFALALFAVAHGVLVSTLAEGSASRAAVRALQARAAADAGAHRALGTAGGAWMDSLALWESRLVEAEQLGELESSGALRRLSRESWLVEGSGAVADRLPARTAYLAWSADPFSRVVALEAVVSVGSGAPVSVAGAIDTSDPARADPPLEGEDCEPWRSELEAWYAASPLPAVSFLADSARPALGLLDFPSLLAHAGVTVTGAGTPAPEELAGVCLSEAPWNWGDPDRPWRPCGSHLPLRGSSGDLRVEGGVGQGLLVVDGDLSLTGGARYHGLVIASGTVRMDAAATLEGMVLAGGGLHVGPSAVIRAVACWPLRGLAGNRAELARFTVLPGTGRIGPL